MTLKTLIIGSGMKGAMYPDGRLTHAHAFSRNGFELVGFYDIHPVQRDTAAERWNTKSFGSLEGAMDSEPDIVTIAASDTEHYEILKRVAWECGPKLVFTEKPFCQSFKQASDIAVLYKQLGIPLQVNFGRRFSRVFQEVKNNTTRGKFLAGCGYYTKGIHNASHLMDLCLMWGVPPEKVEFVEVDRSKLNVFEAVFYFETEKIEILDHGELVIVTPVVQRDDYPIDLTLGYYFSCSAPGMLFSSMEYAAANILDHLTNDAPLLCPASEALKTMKALEEKLGVPHG